MLKIKQSRGFTRLLENGGAHYLEKPSGYTNNMTSVTRIKTPSFFSTGFTLIELLVVISIISLLSSIIFTGVNTARSKARDAKRKSDLQALVQAVELHRNDTGSYLGTDGWIDPGGSVDVSLEPAYLSTFPKDGFWSGSQQYYMYWRKDYSGYVCLAGGRPTQYAFYAKLENPSAGDLATIRDDFDICVRNTWGMNYKAGN